MCKISLVSSLFFKEVGNEFPESCKFSDTLLIMSYAYASLKQYANAEFYLQALTGRFPGSRASVLTQETLDDLSREQ